MKCKKFDLGYFAVMYGGVPINRERFIKSAVIIGGYTTKDCLNYLNGVRK